MEDATVYVVDDISANRELILMLMKTVDMPTFSYTSAQEFLDAYEPGHPDCLLLDMRMPGMSGLELQRHLNENDIRIPIIFITAHNDSQNAVQAMKAGAFDFIEKPFNSQILLDLVYRAIEESRRRIDKKDEETNLNARMESLTPRELDVFKMIVTGEPNKVIAHLLDISERTVEVHRSRVMEKMQTPSVAALVKIAIRMNLDQKSL